MSSWLLYGQTEDILILTDDSDIGYLVEVDLNYSDDIKQKTTSFPFCPENKVTPQNKLSDYMNDKKPNNYTQNKKLICDWSAKKNYLIHYRLSNFYVRHGIVVSRVHEVISLGQST